MKRYLSSAVLLGAILLCAALAARGGSGWRGERVFGDRQGGANEICRVEDGVLRVNINAADEETLQLLDGIGEALGRQIAAYRAEMGPFQSLDELINVPGLGDGKLAAIRERIYCGP